MAPSTPSPADSGKPTHVPPGTGVSEPRFSDVPAAHRSLPGAPAALHAPWRLQYLETMTEADARPAAPPASAAPQASSSFLVEYWNTPASDIKNHVIVRTGEGLILLNGFPYASGHLLVALGEPRPTLLDYTPVQRAALWRLVDCAADLVTRTLEPQGINIGVNQGKAAGAGVPSHLHVHLVPRWGADTNFITVVGQVRIIPASLETMAERYRATWARIRSVWA